MAKKPPRKEDEELVDDCGISISCDRGGDPRGAGQTGRRRDGARQALEGARGGRLSLFNASGASGSCFLSP